MAGDTRRGQRRRIGARGRRRGRRARARRRRRRAGRAAGPRPRRRCPPERADRGRTRAIWSDSRGPRPLRASSSSTARPERQTDEHHRARRRRGRRPLPARSRPVSELGWLRSSTPATTPSCTGCRSHPISTRSPTRSPARSTRNAVGGWRARPGPRWGRWPAMPTSDPPAPTAASTWFNLGDRDLATHCYRTARLGEGATLTEVTAEITRAWGLDVRLLPMCDERFRTRLQLADDGDVVAFQDYFVRLRHSVPIAVDRVRARRCPPHGCGPRRARRGRRDRDRTVEPARVDRTHPRPPRRRGCVGVAPRTSGGGVADRGRIRASRARSITCWSSSASNPP